MNSEHPLERLARARRGGTPPKDELEAMREQAEEELADAGFSFTERAKPNQHTKPKIDKAKAAAKKKASKQARRRNR